MRLLSEEGAVGRWGAAAGASISLALTPHPSLIDRVNGRMVQLKYQLANGDTVEVLPPPLGR